MNTRQTWLHKLVRWAKKHRPAKIPVLVFLALGYILFAIYESAPGAAVRNIWRMRTLSGKLVTALCWSCFLLMVVPLISPQATDIEPIPEAYFEEPEQNWEEYVEEEYIPEEPEQNWETEETVSSYDFTGELQNLVYDLEPRIIESDISYYASEEDWRTFEDAYFYATEVLAAEYIDEPQVHDAVAYLQAAKDQLSVVLIPLEETTDLHNHALTLAPKISFQPGNGTGWNWDAPGLEVYFDGQTTTFMAREAGSYTVFFTDVDGVTGQYAFEVTAPEPELESIPQPIYIQEETVLNSESLPVSSEPITAEPETGNRSSSSSSSRTIPSVNPSNLVLLPSAGSSSSESGSASSPGNAPSSQASSSSQLFPPSSSTAQIPPQTGDTAQGPLPWLGLLCAALGAFVFCVVYKKEKALK